MEIRLDHARTLDQVKELIVDVQDFPKKGVVFKDITPLLKNGSVFKKLIELMAETIPKETTQLLAIESRGFIFAAALAQELGLGFVLVRKPGKLPRPTVSHSYALEYGEDTLLVHSDDLSGKDKVVVVDDVLATGGTAQAAEALCEKVGCEMLGHKFLMELDFLKGRDKLTSGVESFIHY